MQQKSGTAGNPVRPRDAVRRLSGTVPRTVTRVCSSTTASHSGERPSLPSPAYRNALALLQSEAAGNTSCTQKKIPQTAQQALHGPAAQRTLRRKHSRAQSKPPLDTYQLKQRPQPAPDTCPPPATCAGACDAGMLKRRAACRLGGTTLSARPPHSASSAILGVWPGQRMPPRSPTATLAYSSA